METIGSNGFPSSYVLPGGTSTILDVKPLRTLSPMALHPFMAMPGFGLGNFPFMGFNPYGFYPPGAPHGFPSPAPPPFAHPFPAPTAVASPEPVTPVAKVHETLQVDDPPASPPKAHPSNPRHQFKASPSNVTGSAKRKAQKKGKSLTTGNKRKESDTKSSLKKKKIDAPSRPGMKIYQTTTRRGSLRSSSKEVEINTPSPQGLGTKQPATHTVSLRSSMKPENGTATVLASEAKHPSNRAVSIRSSLKKPEVDTPSPPGWETKEPGSIRTSSKKPGIISSSAPVGSTKKARARTSSFPSSGSLETGKAGRKRKKKTSSGGKSKRRAASVGKSMNKETLPLNVTTYLTDQGSAEKILMIFDAIRRRVCQVHDVSSSGSGNGRPDLLAFNAMTANALKVNSTKRIGDIPGVCVGDVFYFRLEMCLIGLHTPPMAGIDSMISRFGEAEDPVAVSIVSSGGYEGDVDEGDVLIYSGQGGISNKTGGKNGRQADQKLERGNLALDRSLRHSVQIRVTRGVKDPSCLTGKMYIYDGLYKIQESWIDQENGGSVFKYKLIREPGQPPLGSFIWKQAQTWKENPASRNGVIIADLSAGVEKIPVCVVNEVDDEKVLQDFLYISRVKYEYDISLMKQISGCKCQNACLPNGRGCDCATLNNGEFPYIGNGVLVSRKPVIYECSPSCSCGSDCRKRVTQNGIKFHFEVFKTNDRGWGVRSWDSIRAGSFICEYIGDVVSKSKIDEDNYDDEYVFNASCERENLLEWDGMYELLGEPTPSKPILDFQQLPTIIDAKKFGNLSRFMNHSCSPNLFWQLVLYDHGDENNPHIMFFARKNIPPMTELTYDYGRSKPQPGKESNRRTCLCGSSNCKGYFG